MENIIGRIVAIAATVILLVVVGALGAHSLSNARLNNAQSDVSSIISNVESLYSATMNYSTLTNTVATSGGVFTPDMVATGAALNPWGGNITLSGAAQQFTLTFDGVPQDGCAQLASTLNGSNILSVSVNGTSMTIPVDPGLASTSCTAGNTNVIVWTAK